MAYTDILNVEIPNEFSCWYDDCSETASIEKLIFSLDKLPNFNYTNYAFGASQFCIMPMDRKDLVIKIPFSGMVGNNEDEDEDYFEEFSQNYCETAVNIYDEAVEAEVSEIFAETSFLGTSKNGHPIYVQPRIAETVSEGTSKHKGSKGSCDYINNKRQSSAYNKYWHLDFDWLVTAVDWYGEEYMEKAMNFIANYVEDLHRGNYGWMADGQPIIFDYAGFDY